MFKIINHGNGLHHIFEHDELVAELEFVTDGPGRHLVCVPYSIENLHLMARALEIKPCWFHKDHYDLPKRRIAELTSRCRLTNSREIVKIVRPWLA